MLMRLLIIKAVATGFMSEKKTHTCFVGPCNQQLSEEDTHAVRIIGEKKKNLIHQNFHMQCYPPGLNLCEFLLRKFLEACCLLE